MADEKQVVAEGAGVSRRNVLRGAVATAAAASALAAPTVARAAGLRRIIVIGAGMAGLTAAFALKQRGHKVTVLEYQDRVGGRVRSHEWPDQSVSEFGTTRFRGGMQLTYRYVRHFRLPVISLNDGLPGYFFAGEAATAANLAEWPWPLAPEERRVTIAASVNRYLARLNIDPDAVLDPNGPSKDLIARLDDVTLGDLLRPVGASEAFLGLLEAHVGAGLAEAPALAVLARLCCTFGCPVIYRIAGGNDRLPQALAAEIGAKNIVLSEQVTEIDQSGSRVVVSTKAGRSYTGDVVISTVPSSVLGEIAFTPRLSSAKRRALGAADWADSYRVLCETERAGWLAKGSYGVPVAGGDRPWERVVDITGNATGNRGNIVFSLTGDNAAAVVAMPERERVSFVTGAFRQDAPRYYERPVTTPVGFSWSEQPWVRGASSRLKLGGAWVLKEWAKAEDRVIFAGDFTTAKSSSVESACESGLRAAQQVDAAAVALATD